MQYVCFLWSLLILIIWIAVYFFLPNGESRREMRTVSFWTSLTGLTEVIFVPKYWSPPSLFDLNLKTGFDIESLIWAFGVGGIAVVLYEWIFRARHQPMPHIERHAPRHRFHLWSLISTPIILIILLLTTNLNPIYSSIIAMIIGGFAAWYCRPDLKKKMLISGFIFLGFYILYFLFIVLVFPNYVGRVWNLKALSGILIIGIPAEELLFAFSFGFLWSSIYEHFKWRKINHINH